MLVFGKRRKPRETREEPIGTESRTKKLNPGITAVRESNAGHIGGRGVLSRLMSCTLF